MGNQLKCIHRIWTAAQQSLVFAITGVIGVQRNDLRLSRKLIKLSITFLLSSHDDSTVN
jgi:hypothetical protein